MIKLPFSFFNVRVKNKTVDIKNEPKILKNMYPEVQESYSNAIKVPYYSLLNFENPLDWFSINLFSFFIWYLG